jgi:hypothetical protein
LTSLWSGTVSSTRNPQKARADKVYVDHVFYAPLRERIPGW